MSSLQDSLDLQPDLAPSAPHDEVAAIKSLQRDAASLAKQFESIARLKASDPEVLDKLHKALAALPSGDQIAGAAAELKSRGEKKVNELRARRASEFRRHEADFIRAAKAANQTVREVGGNTWRVGRLELELQREASRARVLYNREPISKWTPIARREDIEKLLSSGERSLESAAIPDETLSGVLWEAYEHLRRTIGRNAPDARIPLNELFREARVALARHELRGGRPDRRLSRTELPLWAFLYNLDRYRRLLPTLSGEHRLTLETGSQQDIKKGLAMLVNGLDPAEDYKSYCYACAIVG